MLNQQIEEVKDTNQIILFAVKVKVDNTKDKILVKDISVSDSTHAYIYKNFDFLKTVNYNVFTDRRAEDLNFVFPISISVVNVKKEPEPYLPSINFSKNILNYLFFKDYDNDLIADYIFIPGINTVFFQEEQW